MNQQSMFGRATRAAQWCASAAGEVLPATALVIFCFIFGFSASSLASSIGPPTNSARVTALEGVLELNGVVELEVEHLDEWAKEAGNNPWKLVPYVNNRALVGLYPVAIDIRSGRLQFFLQMTPQNREAWFNLLTPPTLNRQVGLSVGLEQKDALDSVFLKATTPASLTVIEWEWAAAAGAVCIAFAIVFLWLAFTTPILTERPLAIGNGKRRRFSLAKVQLALWFFVIFGSFIAIWLSTHNFDTVNSSVVAILGISVGTALGDAYVRASRGEYHNDQSLPGIGSDLTAPHSLYGSRPSSALAKLRKIAWDLLSDGDGYSIYRFQMLAWTVALAAIFLSNVYYDLSMPEFRPDLLYLLGVSSGTYVANRFPETKRESHTNIESGENLAEPTEATNAPPLAM